MKEEKLFYIRQLASIKKILWHRGPWVVFKSRGGSIRILKYGKVEDTVFCVLENRVIVNLFSISKHSNFPTSTRTLDYSEVTLDNFPKNVQNKALHFYRMRKLF